MIALIIVATLMLLSLDQATRFLTTFLLLSEYRKTTSRVPATARAEQTERRKPSTQIERRKNPRVLWTIPSSYVGNDCSIDDTDVHAMLDESWLRNISTTTYHHAPTPASDSGAGKPAAITKTNKFKKTSVH